MIWRGPGVFVDDGWLIHIAAAGEFHLHCVHALVRSAIVAGDVAAFEAAVGDVGFATGGAVQFNCGSEGGIATGAAVGAEIELREFAFEQARDV